MFFSETNRPGRINCPEGNKFEPEYEEMIDAKTGKMILEKTGEIDIVEKIQTSKEACLLDNIIKKYNIDLKKEYKQVVEDTINDLTELPDNFIDTMNFIKKAQEVFNQAPSELREKYNNNVNEFILTEKNNQKAQKEALNEQNDTNAVNLSNNNQKVEYDQETIKKMIEEGRLSINNG